MAAKPTDRLQKALADFDADHEDHRERVEEYDRRYRSYRGLFEKRSESMSWTPKFHPAYVFQSAETMVANLVDPNPKWRLHVHPQMADPARMEQLREGAKANELLLRHQLTLDHWAEKQRPFDLQGLICGITASKQYWQYREGPHRQLRSYEEPLIDGFGQQYGSIPRLEEIAPPTILRDDPTSEIVDVRHLIFQKGAVSLQHSERITHRVFCSYDYLKRLECQANGGKPHEGPCQPGRYYHNVDELKDEKGIAAEHFNREQALFGVRPHVDDIEVLEQWRREGDKLRSVTIGNRKILLGDRESPFWLDHLDHPFPFVVCSGSPDLFRIPGISEVEVMAELQEMLWTIGGQRIANLELINNAIVLIADDAENHEDWIYAPQEQWLVPRPVEETVKLWSPDVRAAQVSLEAEALLKSDLQNVTGGMPFLSGTDTSNIDQTTATGVSIVTSLAQKRLAAKRQQFIWAKARIGEQWCALNQQYVREPRMVPVVGQDGVEAFEEVRPELLQGLFLFETEISDESLMRQERRAEATAKFQIAMQAAMPMAQMGAALNAKAFMDDVLEAYDITDKDRYYSAQPQAPIAGQPSQPAVNGGGGNGVTNTALATGMGSPSSDPSMSPEAAMAGFMRQHGGGAANA